MVPQTAPVSTRRRLFGPGWPIRFLLLGFPLWWMLGATSFILILLAIPMGYWLVRHRPIVVPPAFGWWLLFLVCVVASGVMLGETAPGTIDGTFMARIPAFVLRLLKYLAATIVMLFVINLSEKDLPTRRLVRMQAVFFVVVVTGGLAGTFFYDVEITSPLELVAPSFITANPFASSMLHLSLAQVQGVLGYEAPRPSAPFEFTNTWGNCLSLLMVWFVVFTWAWGGTKRRALCAAVLAASAIPIIYSLNRGLWIALAVAVLYLCVRAAMRGRVQMILGFACATAVAASVIVMSPLYGVIQERLANPHSNEARMNTSTAAVTAASSSPILGYGSTRAVIGSAQTIAVGRSPSCPQCGNAQVGGAGQLWLLLIAQGFVGLVLYVGFFVRTLWIYRHDHSTTGMAAFLVILLGLVYLPVYGAVGVPLTFNMIAVALLWRQRQAAAASPVPAGLRHSELRQAL
ncbi:MAG: O-antigen ligase family protein [Nocardioidaceae bacterium]